MINDVKIDKILERTGKIIAAQDVQRGNMVDLEFLAIELKGGQKHLAEEIGRQNKQLANIVQILKSGGSGV